jgi:allantoicase
MNTNHPFHQWADLAQPRLGSQVVYATDDFFADKARLIEPSEPVFIEGKFDDNGKWMDGWESRRKRIPGHDYCILRLGLPGIIHGVDIDTRHFTGNFPPAASIEACFSADEIPDDTLWQNILSNTELCGDSHHYLEVTSPKTVSHLRLNIYPDGGIARLRVYGEIRRDWDAVGSTVSGTDPIDLVALENGGRALLCNDEHFGSMHNLNVAGRGVNMGDGWETARRRTPGNDWVILRLGNPGDISEVEIDTAHFKGNYPDRASLRGARLGGTDSTELENSDLGNSDLGKKSEQWPLLLPQAKLEMDRIHTFRDELQPIGAITHVRLDIFPDGGVSRLRLRGLPVKSSK